jgi:hypothetical protein
LCGGDDAGGDNPAARVARNTSVMIAVALLLATGVPVVSGKAWIETFTIESMSVDDAPIDVATIRQKRGPVHLCIRGTAARDVTRWLRNRDAKRCEITNASVRQDRFVLEAICPAENGTERRKAIALYIGRHSYAGTYHESGQDDAGRSYELIGRIEAHRKGKCAG